jgi:hypothetical protein
MPWVLVELGFFSRIGASRVPGLLRSLAKAQRRGPIYERDRVPLRVRSIATTPPLGDRAGAVSFENTVFKCMPPRSLTSVGRAPAPRGRGARPEPGWVGAVCAAAGPYVFDGPAAGSWR